MTEMKIVEFENRVDPDAIAHNEVLPSRLRGRCNNEKKNYRWMCVCLGGGGGGGAEYTDPSSS